MNHHDIFLLLTAVFVAGLIVGNKLNSHEPIDPRLPAPGELVVASGGSITAGSGEVRLCGPDALLSASEGSAIVGVSAMGLKDRPSFGVHE